MYMMLQQILQFRIEIFYTFLIFVTVICSHGNIQIPNQSIGILFRTCILLKFKISTFDVKLFIKIGTFAGQNLLSINF